MREVIEESARRFDLHDADAWLAVFAPDAVLVNVRGRRWELPGDRDEVREAFRTALSEASMQLFEVQVRLLRPDLALAHVAMRVGPFVEPLGGRRPAERQLALLVLTKERGRWVVRAFHNTRELAGLAVDPGEATSRD